jgi:hypothetical protein
LFLEDVKTWPKEVVDHLESNLESLCSWEARHACLTSDSCSAAEHDRLHAEIRDLLNKYPLRGYHCTRLTQNEIEQILKEEMSLQNLKSVSARISALEQAKQISPEIAKRLKSELF